ncbi:expressed unknown protein [Ectocarpus siliculosus]|uniref:J domain-containing protein n=1 Tax=Ectocarpus siliculosus TaxID=2880 RepID=D8LEY6_ECTSI|nr:expressed unknown protein [Ectocarpus siliculosus]|eukprot:CBN79806.1 expressed unknown protein [Ectocarpus siliculosus]
MGLRKPRGPDGSRSSGEDPDPEEEEDEGGSMRERMMSYAMPASKRRPPEEDDIWSKHSVFEFKSLNDPDTNACGYKGLSGQPSSSRRRTRSSQAPAPERRLTSSQQPAAFFDGVGDLKEAERPTGTDAAFDADFFAFREKDSLASVKRRREVERRQRSAAGGAGGGDGSAVKVELATQLGLPASSTYDELRTAYRVEIKRCHPDLAGDNEFRVKFLERKFQKLQGCWDMFNAERTASSTATAAEPDVGAGSQEGRSRARARAKRVDWEQQAAAAAAAGRSGRPVMDPDRKVMDPGNTSSC